ncbi:MAG: T6SS immunity protein Tli4 family protein [Telluria sp.]
MEKQLTNVESYCVARSFISVPAEFSASPIVTAQIKTAAMDEQQPFVDVMVRADHLLDSSLTVEVAKRRAELMDRSGDGVDVIRLEKAIDKRTTMFRVQRINEAYISEILAIRGGNLIRASLKSYHNTFPMAEARLIEFISSIDVTTNQLSTHAGNYFCLGPVVVTADLRSEAGNFAFTDGRGSTLELDIDTYARDSRSPLLGRLAGPDSLMAKFNVGPTVLRSAERTVAGMKAQEWLGRVKTGDDLEAYVFAMETMRTNPGKTAPKIHLSLETGERLPNGKVPGKVMSDDEAVKFWDVVVNSIRPASRL